MERLENVYLIDDTNTLLNNLSNMINTWNENNRILNIFSNNNENNNNVTFNIEFNIEDNNINNNYEEIEEESNYFKNCQHINEVLNNCFCIKKGDKILGTSCDICMDEFKLKEYKRIIPACEHYFHKKCIDKWLKKKSTCPICRKELL